MPAAWTVRAAFQKHTRKKEVPEYAILSSVSMFSLCTKEGRRGSECPVLDVAPYGGIYSYSYRSECPFCHYRRKFVLYVSKTPRSRFQQENGDPGSRCKHSCTSGDVAGIVAC